MATFDSKHIYDLDRNRRETLDNEILAEMEFNRLTSAFGLFDAVSRSEAVIEFEMDGTIITANRNFQLATGYSLDELAGNHHRIFVGRGYASSRDYTEFWRRLGEGQHMSGECLRYGKSGKELWLRATYNPVLMPDGTLLKVVKIAQDITDLKQKQLLTKSSMENLRDLRMDEISGQALENIYRSSQKIEQLMTLIEEIAGRTNLLGINAEIEASHAGEAGKGFSVVAREIRMLASRSSDAADEIGSLIQESAKAITKGRTEISEVSAKGVRLIDTVTEIQQELSETQCDSSGAYAERQQSGLATRAA